MPDRITLPWGYIEYGLNEVSIVSTVEDPPAVRLATEGGKCVGKVSFNAKRGDTQYEIGLIRVNEEPVGSGRGEMYFGVTDTVGSDDGMKEAILISPDRIEMSKRVIFKSGADVESGGGRVSEMWSQDGRYVTVQQGDGNFVTYDTVGAEWKATWSAWHGRIN